MAAPGAIMYAKNLQFLLLASHSGLLPAGETEIPQLADEGDHCPPLMTEAECRAHHRILQHLTSEEERGAYLAMHDQLLLERRAACRCLGNENLAALKGTVALP